MSHCPHRDTKEKQTVLEISGDTIAEWHLHWFGPQLIVQGGFQLVVMLLP